MHITRNQISAGFTSVKHELMKNASLNLGALDACFGICAALDRADVSIEVFEVCSTIIDTRLGNSRWLQGWLRQRGFEPASNPGKLYQCRLDWLDSLIAEFTE